MNPYKNIDLRKYIKSIPKGELESQSRIENERNQKIYLEFIEALRKNKCFLCNSQMNTFNQAKPCFHWFTYPEGIRKKHFKYYLNNPLSFFRLDCYFRWLANSEKPISNINDLKDDTSKSSYLETTIKYRNIEWAFSIGHTDKVGHENSSIGNVPHYHLQMRINDKIFLKFGDFHIRFTDEDLFMLELLEQAGDLVTIEHTFGQGIGIIENEEYLKIIDELMKVSDDEETAPFERQTIIIAQRGKPIPGELIQKAIEESKRTKKPVGKILQKNLTDAKIATIISPGKGVPDMTKRSGKK